MKHLFCTSLLALFVTACNASLATTNPAASQTASSTQTFTATITPTPTLTPTPSPTHTPSPTLTPTITPTHIGGGVPWLAFIGQNSA